MDFITIPQALFMFYGGLILSCGAALGFIVGRNMRHNVKMPEPPNLVENRVTVLEHELLAAQQELAQLSAERQFMRELETPSVPRHEPGREELRAVA